MLEPQNLQDFADTSALKIISDYLAYADQYSQR